MTTITIAPYSSTETGEPAILLPYNGSTFTFHCQPYYGESYVTACQNILRNVYQVDIDPYLLRSKLKHILVDSLIVCFANIEELRRARISRPVEYFHLNSGNHFRGESKFIDTNAQGIFSNLRGRDFSYVGGATPVTYLSESFRPRLILIRFP